MGKGLNQAQSALTAHKFIVEIVFQITYSIFIWVNEPCYGSHI